MAVNAGPDTSVTLGQQVAITATSTSSGAITSRTWSIIASPGGSSVAGDPTTAAGRLLWGQPVSQSDDFTTSGTPNTSRWRLYDGAGLNGLGDHDGSLCTVTGGSLVLTGNSKGHSGGLAHTFSQRYGKWEVRLRSTATGTGGTPYRVLLDVWPGEDHYPAEGEYSFVDLPSPGASSYTATIHYPTTSSSTQQETASAAADTSQWHNVAVEWDPSGITLYLDGDVVAKFAGGGNSHRRDIQTMASGYLTIQLAAQTSGTCTPARLEVDSVKVYPRVPAGGTGTPIGSGAALAWTPTLAGTYTLRYTEVGSEGTYSDDVAVTVAPSTAAPTPPAPPVVIVTPGAQVPMGPLPRFVDGVTATAGDLTAVCTDLDTLCLITTGKPAASGVATKPLCVVVQSAAGSIPTGTTPAALIWSKALVDTDGMWSAATPDTLTIRVPGWYQLDMQAVCPNTAGGAGARRAAFYVNGLAAVNLAAEHDVILAAPGKSLAQVRLYDRFPAGTQIRGCFSQSSGAALATGAPTDFGGQWLAAVWDAPY